MKKKISIKIISSILLCTIFTYTLPVLAYTKDETIYSKLDNSGNKYNTIVSTHIKNSESQELINDLSDLLNIENTNGDEKFTQDGNSIIWQSNKNDIYYQGESQKELPIECNVKYELNGKEISAEELAGKSGSVKITLQYKNKDEHIVNINGKNVKMYTPFIAVAGTIIKNDNNKNITISNGKVINDGTKSIVMGIAMPGMQESLDISKSRLDVPDSIEIKMDATDFELNNIVTFVTPKVIEESDLEFFDKLDEIYAKVRKLQISSNEIKAGADTLATGAIDLKKGVNSAYNGSKKIKSEVQKSTKTLKQDNSEALDKKTLNQIGKQAEKTATTTIGKQKETIGNEAAKTATSTIEKQKGAIGNEAAKTATNTIEKQKGQIGKQAEETATNIIEKQKEQIGNGAAKTAANTIEKQKQSIGKNAEKQVENFKLSKEQVSKIKKAVEAGLEKNDSYKSLTKEQKALVLPFAQSAAESAVQITASQVASGVANQTAQSVAEQIAGQVANQTAQSVAGQIAGQVANQTAQTIAGQVSSQVASQTAQNVAGQVAGQVANQTAQSVAEQTAIQTAKTTATSTAKTVANEVKSTAQKTVISQMSKLEKGLGELETGLYKINRGTGDLSNGLNTLSKGITTFNKDGIDKICNYINGDLKDITQRVKELTELSKQYNNFTMINGDNDGNVKFIMIIDSIKRHEKNDESKEEVILNEEQKTEKSEEE